MRRRARTPCGHGAGSDDGLRPEPFGLPDWHHEGLLPRRQVGAPPRHAVWDRYRRSHRRRWLTLVVPRVVPCGVYGTAPTGRSLGGGNRPAALRCAALRCGVVRCAELRCSGRICLRLAFLEELAAQSSDGELPPEMVRTAIPRPFVRRESPLWLRFSQELRGGAARVRTGRPADAEEQRLCNTRHAPADNAATTRERPTDNRQTTRAELG